MRLTCLFLVGIAASGCKEKQQATPQAAPGVVRATPGPNGSASEAPQAHAQPPPPAPALEAYPSFDAEERDAAWAGATEQAIHAVAPQLTDVSCKRMQCRVTLTAASEAELVEATEKLQSDDSLKGLDGAQHIVLTRPEERDGKHAMKIYVRFDRD